MTLLARRFSVTVMALAALSVIAGCPSAAQASVTDADACTGAVRTSTAPAGTIAAVITLTGAARTESAYDKDGDNPEGGQGGAGDSLTVSVPASAGQQFDVNVGCQNGYNGGNRGGYDGWYGLIEGDGSGGGNGGGASDITPTGEGFARAYAVAGGGGGDIGTGASAVPTSRAARRYGRQRFRGHRPGGRRRRRQRWWRRRHRRHRRPTGGAGGYGRPFTGGGGGGVGAPGAPGGGGGGPGSSGAAPATDIRSAPAPPVAVAVAAPVRLGRCKRDRRCQPGGRRGRLGQHHLRVPGRVSAVRLLWDRCPRPTSPQTVQVTITGYTALNLGQASITGTNPDSSRISPPPTTAETSRSQAEAPARLRCSSPQRETARRQRPCPSLQRCQLPDDRRSDRHCSGAGRAAFTEPEPNADPGSSPKPSPTPAPAPVMARLRLSSGSLTLRSGATVRIRVTLDARPLSCSR